MLLLRYIRVVVLILSFLLSLLIYVWVIYSFPAGTIQVTKLTKIYALVALGYLYAALLASPLTQFFPSLPGRGHYLRARRAIGQSAFYFAVLHSSLAFWGQLGGFQGLSFLTAKYLLAISLSFIALTILTFMAATSFNRMVSRLGFHTWKLLHRFVYLAGILILIHALLIGTHFRDLSRAIPRLIFLAVAFLLLLEALRFDRYRQTKRNKAALR